MHPNGSIYLVFNSDDMVMVRADNWAGPYEVVLHGACGGGEDPFLYVSRLIIHVFTSVDSGVLGSNSR